MGSFAQQNRGFWMRNGKSKVAFALLLGTLFSMFGGLAIAQAPPRPASVTLTIAVSDQQLPGVSGMISAFLANPLGAGVSSVNVVSEGTRANDQLTYLSTQLAAGSTTLDVVGLDPSWPALFADNNWLVQLDSLLTTGELNAFVPALVNEGIYQGKTWCYPYFMNMGMLYYRKDILQRNELGPENLTTWADVNKTCNKILSNATEMALNPNLVGYVGQFDNYEGGTVAFFEWIGSNGVTNIFNSSNQPVLSTTAAVTEAMTFLYNLFAPINTGLVPYIIPRYALTMDEGSSIGAWKAGNAILMRQWTFGYTVSAGQSNLNATDAEGNYTQFGILPIPTFHGLTTEKSSCVGGAVLGISKFSTHQTEALNLIRFLCNNLTAQNYELTQLGNFPALNAAYSMANLNAIGYNWTRPFYDAFGTLLTRPIIPQYAQISTVVASEFTSLLSGRETISTALSAMDTQINQILAGSPTGIAGFDVPLTLLSIGAAMAIIAIVQKRRRSTA